MVRSAARKFVLQAVVEVVVNDSGVMCSGSEKWLYRGGSGRRQHQHWCCFGPMAMWLFDIQDLR